MVQANQQYTEQSEGKSHDHSRNAMRGQGMVTTVDSTATSDPYTNSGSSAANVDSVKSPNRISAASSPATWQRKGLLIPAAVGIGGFAGTHLALRSLPPVPRLASAAVSGLAIAYITSTM